MHSEVGVYLQMEDWNEDDSHANFVEHVNSSNFVFYSSSFELCVHLHGTIGLDIFFISPNSRPLPTFLPFPHSTRRRIQAWGPTPPTPSSQVARRRPCTAELWQGAKRTSVRITRWPPWTTWRSFWKSRGSWLRRGWGLWMERGDLPGGGFSGAYFLCGQGLRAKFFLFDFPVLLGHLFWAN